MSTKMSRICACGRKVAGGERCICQKARDAQRPTAAARGYDTKWRALRLKFLHEHPVCCEPGCCEPSNEVDHIVSIKERPELRLEWSNLRPYCKSHHSARTARDQSFGRASVKW